MKSVGVRIAFWYALASLLTLGLFFRIGRHQVEQHIIHSLDTGIAAEFEQVKRRLGSDFARLAPEDLPNLITPFASVRYGIEILKPDGRAVYRSRNLGERVIPDQPMKGDLLAIWMKRLFSYQLTPPAVPALREYNALMGDLGEMRIGEFRLSPHTVRIAVAKEQVRSLVAAYREVFYVLLTLMVIVSSVIGYALSHMLLRPVRLIQETANHISSDNLSERIPVSPVEDEISNLARLLNQMFDRLESSFNQVRRFTAEASHELKTPLSLMRLQTEKLLLEGGLNPAQEESLQVVVEEINRLNKIIEELLFLSRAEANAISLATKAQDPRAFMASFIPDAQVLADSRGVRLADIHRGQGLVEFDSRWLRQVLLNLLSNALNYTPPGQCVTLTSQVGPTAWQVVVEDAGPGVPAAERERIFERFVRLAHSSQHEKGSGLGLAICRSIITLHQGRIWAEDATPGPGLRMIFEIPLAAVPESAARLPRPN